MNSETMQCTPLQLASGKELYLYSNESQIVFQMRQIAPSDDPGAQSFQVATEMSLMECVKLATTMLQKAAPLLEGAQKSESALAF
jgi:hypothetical protein